MHLSLEAPASQAAQYAAFLASGCMQSQAQSLPPFALQRAAPQSGLQRQPPTKQTRHDQGLPCWVLASVDCKAEVATNHSTKGDYPKQYVHPSAVCCWTLHMWVTTSPPSTQVPCCQRASTRSQAWKTHNPLLCAPACRRHSLSNRMPLPLHHLLE